MNKKLIIFALILVSVLILSSCSVETSARVENPDDCSSQACRDCVSQNTVCSLDNKYMKGYSWANGACGSDVSVEFCENGCLLGKCLSEDLGAVCFPKQQACGQELTSFKDECNIAGTLGCIAGNLFDPWSECLKCQDIPIYENTCRTISDIPFMCTKTVFTRNTRLGGLDLFCNIKDVVTCPQGCDDSTNIPHKCKGGIVSVCIEDQERCSDGIDFETKDENGNPYRCENGQWKKTDDCSGSQLCEEFNQENAVCRIPDDKFCLNNNFNCISCSDKAGAFDTLDECLNSKIVYCISKDRKQCIQRNKECNQDELEFSGTDLNVAKLNCEAQVCGKEGNACCDNNCDKDLVCIDKIGFTYSDGSQVRICVKEKGNGTGSICEAECSDKKTLGLIPNYPCIWSCQLKNFFKPLIIGASIIVGLIVMLISLSILNKKFPKKKDLWIGWTFGIIFGAIMGALLFFYFWIAIIFLIIYIIAMILIKNTIKK